MNVVLLHLNKFNETLPTFCSLYQKCYNSQLKEFKNDNLIVIHSFEELFEKFPLLHSLITENSNFNYQFTNMSIFEQADLIRFLLTSILDDYFYLDSDIYCCEGFREKLQNIIEKYSNKNLIFCCNGRGMQLFYNRKKRSFTKQEKNFFGKTYTSDYYFELESGILNHSDTTHISPDEYLPHLHYQGLAKLSKAVRIEKVKSFPDTPEFRVCYIFNNSQLFMDDEYYPVSFHFEKDKITLEDVLPFIGCLN